MPTNDDIDTTHGIARITLDVDVRTLCVASLTASSHTETSVEARVDAVALHVQHTLLPSLSRSSARSTSTRADVGITGLVIDDMTSNDRSIACMLQLLDAASSSSSPASIMMRVVSDGARRRRQIELQAGVFAFV